MPNVCVSWPCHSVSPRTNYLLHRFCRQIQHSILMYSTCILTPCLLLDSGYITSFLGNNHQGGVSSHWSLETTGRIRRVCYFFALFAAHQLTAKTSIKELVSEPINSADTPGKTNNTLEELISPTTESISIITPSPTPCPFTRVHSMNRCHRASFSRSLPFFYTSAFPPLPNFLTFFPISHVHDQRQDNQT